MVALFGLLKLPELPCQITDYIPPVLILVRLIISPGQIVKGDKLLAEILIGLNGAWHPLLS